MKIKFLFFLFCLACLWGCGVGGMRPKEVLKPVSYSVVERSAVFHRKNMAFSLDSLGNNLLIHLTINELGKNFPFPVNKEYNDTLTKTAFNFDFFCGGKPLLSDYNFLQGTLHWNRIPENTELHMLSDTINLKLYNDLFIEVPFYAFHNLKKGKQTIELVMWQDQFTDRLDMRNQDGSYRTLYLSTKKPLFSARIKFDIFLPEIYCSTVYGQGLVLKNDSTFSPAGMDNTLWKSSYPDIYWAIEYPKGKLYAQTPYETSTDRYVGLDTFKVYHYYKNDSIGFEVYDHDNLSRDDFLGSWWGALNKLTKPVATEISFGNVKSFKVALKETGIIN
jgi:hypothetical protein